MKLKCDVSDTWGKLERD